MWEFSLAIYARPRVSETCLQLQDEAGFDVNLLLFCIWYGQKRGDLAPKLLHRAAALSAEWQALLVAPLRQIRRNMKDWQAGAESAENSLGSEDGQSPQEQTEQLRGEDKRLELAAEAQQQERLYRLCDGFEPAATATGKAAVLSNLQQLSALLHGDARAEALLRLLAGLAESPEDA